MTIIHDANTCRFEAVSDAGEIMGEISYDPRGNGILAADHTVVRPEFRGQNVASTLLDALADYARESGRKIHPICSFVVTAFKRNPERYSDVMTRPEDDFPTGL